MTDQVETTHTARVHAWYVSSDGEETHVTRRDDGKWYINSVNPHEDPQFLAMDDIVSIFELAVEEQRPHGWMPGLPDGERWDDAVRHLMEPQDDSDVDGPGPDGK